MDITQTPKHLCKHLLGIIGLKLERINKLEETIPIQYNKSLFLPRLYKDYLVRIMYFRDQLEKVRNLAGDIVECGVSIGHGTLLFLLLNEYLNSPRKYFGFDSFEGFPEPVDRDEATPITGKDYWATPPETVMQVLKDGGISDKTLLDYVRLKKGWFTETLKTYEGQIAILHLDCDLYDSYKISLETLYNKVVPNGLIMFDEYNDKRWPGASKAIDEFFADKPEKVVSHHNYQMKYYVKKL